MYLILQDKFFVRFIGFAVSLVLFEGFFLLALGKFADYLSSKNMQDKREKINDYNDKQHHRN